MTQPQARLEAPALATPADAADIAALEEAFASGRWSLAAWEEETVSPRGQVLVQRVEGVLVGVAALSIAGDVADLNRVLVAPTARRGGIARRLVTAGLAWAAGRGAHQVMLEVEASNEPARALYAQVGFVPLATRANYYGPGRHAQVWARPLREDV